MKQKNIIQSLFLAAALLGLSAAARAADSTPAVPASGTLGLLGQTYAGLSYSYVNLGNSPVNADRYGFEYNQSLTTGLDAVFNYDWTQAGLNAGDRAQQRAVDAVLRAFSTSTSWGKPYVEAGVGYDWMNTAGVRNNSFAWIAGAGIEFQATPALTVTPFVRWLRTNSFADHNTVDYGVKANDWVTKQWGVLAGIDRNDSQDMSYKAGFNVRF
jgi:opacity protein-like surface antigen